jgi:hypothetical protein
MATTAESETFGEGSTQPKSKRRMRRWLVFLLAILLLLAAAPTLVTTTPLRNVALAMAVPSSGDKEVAIGSVSAGWLSTISVNDLEVRQRDGKWQASVPSLTMDCTLIALLFDHNDLGVIRLERPVIEAQLVQDHTKAKEELTATAPSVEHETAKISLDLQVVDGTVTLHDSQHNRDWKLEQLTVDLQSPRGAGAQRLDEAHSPLESMSGKVRFTTAGANVDGFVTGSAQVEAQLVDGWVRVSPLVADISGGKLSISPRVQLVKPWQLEMDAGRVIDHVQITPEMCDARLKFALPVLAEVTEIDGQFSVDLENCHVPLETPATGEAAGKISIHSIELGPGRLLREVLPVIEKIKDVFAPNAEKRPIGRLRIANESQVEFRVAQGKVYHQGLRLELPQMTIETSGSVGFDESLAMTAEIRLPERWLNKGILAELKSQPLKIPIGGTLRKPKVEMPEFRGMTREAMRETAKGLLRNEVKRGLDRLLKPKDE